MYTGRQAKTVVSGLDPFGWCLDQCRQRRKEGRKEGREREGNGFAYLVLGSSSWQVILEAVHS
jgi:hypothetical protein